jgi:DNA-binding beta-propeller fold protein YncE
LAGCEDASGPQLDVAQVDYWQVPVDGRSLPAPRSMTAAPNGEVYVLDNAGRILVYTAEGRLARQWRMPDTDIGYPESVCLLLDGRVAIADTHYHRVVYFDQQGKLLGTTGSYGKGEGQFIYPVGITRDDKGFFYVCEYGGNDRVQKFKAADGSFVLQFGSYGVGAGAFQRPSGLFWREGRLFVADAINNRIQVFSDRGDFLGILGANDKPVELRYPYDVAPGIDDDLYVIEYGAGRLTRLSFEGDVLGRFGHTGRREGEFSTPWGLAVTVDGRVIIADTGNRRIVELRL